MGGYIYNMYNDLHNNLSDTHNMSYISVSKPKLWDPALLTL